MLIPRESTALPTPAERIGLLAEVVVFFGVWNELLAWAPGASTDGVRAGDLLAFAAVAAPLTLVLVAGAARLRGQRLGDLGLHRPTRGWLRSVWLGAAAGMLLILAAGPLEALLEVLGLPYTDPFILDGGLSVLGSAVAGVAAGGFMEELVYRGYGFARLERACASSRRPAQGVVLAALVTACVFGAMHTYQGPQAVVVVTFWGLGFATLRQLARGQLVPVMIAHGSINVLAFVARGS